LSLACHHHHHHHHCHCHHHHHDLNALFWFDWQAGTVVNIRVRPGADGSAPGIKVQLASGVQQYYTFADVVPHVHSEQEEEERVAEREYDWDEVRRKRTFCAIFILKTIILPRQARDKHRKNSKKRVPFSCRAA
jgi:hypothetical protein